MRQTAASSKAASPKAHALFTSPPAFLECSKFHWGLKCPGLSLAPLSPHDPPGALQKYLPSNLQILYLDRLPFLAPVKPDLLESYQPSSKNYRSQEGVQSRERSGKAWLPKDRGSSVRVKNKLLVIYTQLLPYNG